MPKRDELVDLLFELGRLKRLPRTGWSDVGVKYPESVADHSYRAAAMAYFLAKETGADRNRCAVLALFHDVIETRIGDLSKTNKMYLNKTAVERKALADWRRDYRQMGDVAALLAEFSAQKTLEAKTARDAEIVELVVQLKEYEPQISAEAFKRFARNTKKLLRTKEGRALYNRVLRSDTNWWKRVLYKKF